MNKIRNFFEKIGQKMHSWQGKTKDLHVYQRLKRRRRLAVAAVLVLCLLVCLLAVYFRVERSLTAVGEGWTDVNGTIYEPFGGNLLKYSPDGVSSISPGGKVNWSVTYSMQTPVADICGTTAAVADQLGTQVYILNKDGLMGQFDTTLPILKVKVASQGVVAVALEDGDVTWINFYESNGTEIAVNRTTINDSGYPLDMDLSPDGLKIMVSYLLAAQGTMSTRVAFYNFDSIGQAEINNLVSSEVYTETVIPETYFVDADTSVAIHHDGFSVYRGSQIPKLEVQKSFSEEILSVFHDGEYLGFVFASEKEGSKYRIEVYSLNGKRKMCRYLTEDYSGIRLQNKNVIVFNEKMFEVYSLRGRKKVSVSCGKAVTDVLKAGSFGKYLVSTADGTGIAWVW